MTARPRSPTAQRLIERMHVQPGREHVTGHNQSAGSKHARDESREGQIPLMGGTPTSYAHCGERIDCAMRSVPVADYSPRARPLRRAGALLVARM